MPDFAVGRGSRCVATRGLRPGHFVLARALERSRKGSGVSAGDCGRDRGGKRRGGNILRRRAGELRAHSPARLTEPVGVGEPWQGFQRLDGSRGRGNGGAVSFLRLVKSARRRRPQIGVPRLWGGPDRARSAGAAGQRLGQGQRAGRSESLKYGVLTAKAADGETRPFLAIDRACAGPWRGVRRTATRWQVR